MAGQEPRKIEWTEKFRQNQDEHLSRIAAKMKLPSHLIEEAVLEAWSKIVRQLQSIHGSDEMKRFLALSRKIMHDTVVDILRRCDRIRPASLHDLPLEPKDDKASDPAALSASKELHEWVSTKLEVLRKERPSYAWLLNEHFLNERPLEELAAEKGMTKHAMESQQTRALKALRRLMGNCNPDGEAAP